VRSFAERRRLLRSRFNSEWWSIFFGGPIGNFLNALIADVRWITPNSLTVLGFLCKMVACPLLLWRHDLAAIVLLQLNTVCDCMDGSLARYRGTSSVLGSYLDKVTDAIGMVAVTACVGLRVFQDTGDLNAFLAVAFAGVSHVIRGYVYWVVSHIEASRAVAKRSAGVDDRVDFRDLPLRARLMLYVKAFPRIFVFAESDLYFWIGLGFLGGWAREICYLLGGATAVWFVIVLVVRTRTVLAIDRNKG
jgi:phosphatidylglycerophosphate synthase